MRGDSAYILLPQQDSRAQKFLTENFLLDVLLMHS